MATIFNEEKFITDTTLLLDQKLKSPTVRFLDQTPSFTTYFHLNIHETTSDEGYRDAESIIGPKSPMRFQRIEKFPIYGLDPVVLQIQDSEIGLDTSYEGDATILPNTIKPLENDFFVINILDDCFLFRVISIEYDSAMQDNFYKIHFKLDSNSSDKRDDLETLVHEKYTCTLENIGTENSCIIQSDYKDQIDKISDMYSNMVQLYLSVFYVERYNVLLGEIGDGSLLYDPYMTEFINTNGLFYKKSSLTSIYLDEQFRDPKKKLKYERSVYRFMERRDVSRMSPFYYITFKGMSNCETAFSRWRDERVQIVDILPSFGPTPPSTSVFSDIFVTATQLNTPTGNRYSTLLKKFIRNEEISIFDIDTDLQSELLSLDGNLEMYFITPLLLYIMKITVADFYTHGYATKDTGTKNAISNNPT